MKESNVPSGNSVVLGLQISLLVAFYLFAAGVVTFLGSAVYRSVVNNDHPAHAVILGSVITLAFLILTSVVTMVFTTIIKEGRKKVPEQGGSFNESNI